MDPSPAVAADDTIEHTKPPFLRRVRIRGYKSIGFCDVSLQPLTILVGRNAAGKSNFLDALAFLREVVNDGAVKAINRRGNWDSVVCRSTATSAIEIEIEAGFSINRPHNNLSGNGNPAGPNGEPISDESHERFFSACYTFQIAPSSIDTPFICFEKLDLRDEKSQEVIGFELERNTSESQHKKTNGKSGQVGGRAPTRTGLRFRGIQLSDEVTGNFALQRGDICFLSVLGIAPFFDFCENLRAMEFYNVNPAIMREYRKPNRGFMLERDGKNLASVIERLNEIEPESVQRVREYVNLIAPEVHSFQVLRHEDAETIQFQMANGSKDSSFTSANMSDGTLRVLAALVAAYQIALPHGYPSTIGIEEPEAALHPAAMRALVDALDDATQRTQILLTTHSADLLSGRDINPGQVLVVRNRDGQTKITPVDPASREIVDKELYSLAELQRMDRLELDETDLKRQAQLECGKEAK